MNTPVWISLGSNLGDRRAILDHALLALSQTPGVVVSAISSYHETAPVGGPARQGLFLNAAARLETTLSPRQLLEVTQEVERNLGRVRTVRWGERTLDLDLLIYGSKFLDDPDLKLPHPRLAVRRFVLQPLAEIAPEITDTITRQRVGALLRNLDRHPRILMIDESVSNKIPGIGETLAAALAGEAITLLPSLGEPLCSTPHLQMLPHPHDQLNKIDQLRSALVKAKSRHGGWTVCNFIVDVQRLREVVANASPGVPSDSLVARHSMTDSRNWFATMLVDIPDPTLIVASAGSNWFRRPGVARTPIYWPEAIDSDAIVAEVVAICRGIEAV